MNEIAGHTSGHINFDILSNLFFRENLKFETFSLLFLALSPLTPRRVALQPVSYLNQNGLLLVFHRPRGQTPETGPPGQPSKIHRDQTPGFGEGSETGSGGHARVAALARAMQEKVLGSVRAISKKSEWCKLTMEVF